MNSLMRVLLIEDDPEHAELIRTQISRKHAGSVNIQWAPRLSQGLKRLADSGADVILLDLGLPDSTSDKTLSSVLPHAHGIPVVVLSSIGDEDFGIQALHEGAQDYISKSWMDGEILFRSLRYAIERKSAEEELRRANQAKDEFLATLSHELRTPIGVIKGFAELMLQDQMPEEERRLALTAILRNSEIQVSLINDLLDMSRIMTGNLVLESRPLDLASILREAIDTVRVAVVNKNIEIKTEWDTSIGLVLGDHVRLLQVMWNVLSNAIKFTPPGGHVTLRLRRSGSSANIEVEDNGEGIHPEFLPYVFDRFRQQDSSIRRRHGGLGLGLAIVKYLVELHGGSVSAASAGPGKGSIFKVSLPLAAYKYQADKDPRFKSELSTQPPLTVPPQQHTGDTRLLAGLKVLAIDDSPDSLALVQLLLKRQGATVSTAGSATEGFEKWRREVPDLILCDIGMPDEDGYSFIKRLRSQERAENRPPTPAIALTAYTRDEEKQMALEAGFHAHLAKPINEPQLMNTLATFAPKPHP
ncbi:MAG: response regulator [Bdellovibrionaceae bacterium]|nr:response regulator [Pseudobdellovibrionaceae bacterium]